MKWRDIPLWKRDRPPLPHEWEESDQREKKSWSKSSKTGKEFSSRPGEEGHSKQRNVSEEKNAWCGKCILGNIKRRDQGKLTDKWERSRVGLRLLVGSLRPHWSLVCKQWNHRWVTGEGCGHTCILEISSLQYGWWTWGQIKQTSEEVLGVIQVRIKSSRTRTMAKGVKGGECLWTLLCWLDFIVQLDNINNLPSILWINWCFAIRGEDLTPPGPRVPGKVHSLLNNSLTSERVAPACSKRRHCSHSSGYSPPCQQNTNTLLPTYTFNY